MELADLYTSKLGRKSARLREKDTHDPVIHVSKKLMIAPFGPSLAFEKTNGDTRRLTLPIRCDDLSTLAFFETLDVWALLYLEENSERLLGRKMTAEQVRASYKPCLRVKDNGKYEPLLHAKITLGGDDPTRFWDENKQQRDPPELTASAWQRSPAQYRFSVPQLWIMAGQCGFLVNITDCKIFPDDDRAIKDRECPL